MGRGEGKWCAPEEAEEEDDVEDVGDAFEEADEEEDDDADVKSIDTDEEEEAVVRTPRTQPPTLRSTPHRRAGAGVSRPASIFCFLAVRALFFCLLGVCT